MEQFNGLKSDGFSEATERTHWRHATQPVHSLLLPIPPGRVNFVATKARSCYLAIEHYYSDALLARFGVADDPVVADSAVFCITTDSRKKASLTAALSSLDQAEFVNFGLLFERLTQLLSVPGEQTPSPLPASGALISQTFESHDPVQQNPFDFTSPPIIVSTNGLESAELIPKSEAVVRNAQGDSQAAQKKND